MRRYDQAVKACQNVLEMDEGFWYPHWGLGLDYFQKEMYEEALVEYQKAKDLYKGWQPQNESSIGITYARMGRREKAQQVLNSLLERSKQEFVPSIVLADLYFVLGENNQGFDWLEFLLSIPSEMSISLLRLDPAWAPLRDNPRFKRLLEEGK